MHFLHQLVAGHGRQKGGQGPSWILKCDIFLLNFLRKKVFLVSRRKKKIPPLWPPHGKIPSDAHTIGIHCLNLVSVSLRNAWLCCNLAGGVALIVWFTTNGICAKNKNIYAWCEQAIIEWSWHVNSIVAWGFPIATAASVPDSSPEQVCSVPAARMMSSTNLWLFYQ